MGASSSKTVFTTCMKHCTLWKTDRSPPCRAVLMALDAMNLSITEVDVNMDKGEHRAPELCVLNPLQTLPIFQDKEVILNDSHAITAYLAARYANYGKFLPRDPGGRAIIDQLMHYDSGILYPRFRAAANPILYENCKCVLPQFVCDIECAYRDLECMMAGRTWLGGSWPTLGDITIAATLSTLNVMVPIDKTRFPRLSCWLHRMSEEIYYITANKKGLGEFSTRLDRGCVYDDESSKCPRSSIRRRAGVPEQENKK